MAEVKKLVLQHKPLKVEINDEGDYIEIDTLDFEFPLRYQKCYEQVIKIENKMRAEKAIIEKKTDKKKKNHLLSQNDEEVIKMMNERYTEMRKVIDDLFGEGTSLKVFGTHNWITMFHEFFDALTPFMAEAGINDEKTYDAIMAKYGNEETNEL